MGALTYSVAKKEARLADPTVANEKELEEVVARVVRAGAELTTPDC